MIAFVHASKTSAKNALIASSVCGLAGLLGIDVLLEDDEPRLPVVVDGGVEVYGVNGGNEFGEGVD